MTLDNSKNVSGASNAATSLLIMYRLVCKSPFSVLYFFKNPVKRKTLWRLQLKRESTSVRYMFCDARVAHFDGFFNITKIVRLQYKAKAQCWNSFLINIPQFHYRHMGIVIYDRLAARPGFVSGSLRYQARVVYHVCWLEMRAIMYCKKP